MTRLRSVSEIMPVLNDEICLKHGIILFPRHIETELPLQPDCTCLMREAATIVKKYFAQVIKNIWSFHHSRYTALKILWAF